jgi:hypothetical protein
VPETSLAGGSKVIKTRKKPAARGDKDSAQRKNPLKGKTQSDKTLVMQRSRMRNS